MAPPRRTGSGGSRFCGADVERRDSQKHDRPIPGPNDTGCETRRQGAVEHPGGTATKNALFEAVPHNVFRLRWPTVRGLISTSVTSTAGRIRRRERKAGRRRRPAPKLRSPVCRIGPPVAREQMGRRGPKHVPRLFLSWRQATPAEHGIVGGFRVRAGRPRPQFVGQTAVSRVARDLPRVWCSSVDHKCGAPGCERGHYQARLIMLVQHHVSGCPAPLEQRFDRRLIRQPHCTGPGTRLVQGLSAPQAGPRPALAAAR